MTTKVGKITMNENVVEENTKMIDEKNDEIEEEVKMEVEIKTGVSFPVKLNDGKQLNTMGIRKKKILALGVNIYAFGIYADNMKLKEDLKAKFGKAPEKANKELYDAVINTDVGMTVRLVIVYGSLTMSMVRKNFDEGLGASLKKLNGGQKNEDLINKYNTFSDLLYTYLAMIYISQIHIYKLYDNQKLKYHSSIYKFSI
ncbi:fatty-acid-binding protein 1-like [Dioscorea cayenensis subsp. rotundata]|uniref:Fatty-acid-binding protein 1-like n=1 Tax=Dioscorea cayennensis subsp. rotundata TaxID=55577 RepID=A0AB40C1H5_DIOCR|nr:fatty-acid-binding protein 1-like [Dioscorea cayenensis subsp. rotundata]